MPEIQKVSVALTGEQLTLVKAAVETGEYATTSEVVREALRDWQHKREFRDLEIERLRAAWKAGIESGSATPIDWSKFRKEAKSRLAKAASKRA